MALTSDGPVLPVLDTPSKLDPRRTHIYSSTLCELLLLMGGGIGEPLRYNPLTFTYRKLPTFLADHVEKNDLQGKLRYSLFVGASSGAETENRWASLDMIERRTPHQVGKAIAKGINSGKIKFFDKHLSMFPVDLIYVSPPSAK